MNLHCVVSNLQLDVVLQSSHCVAQLNRVVLVLALLAQVFQSSTYTCGLLLRGDWSTFILRFYPMDEECACSDKIILSSYIRGLMLHKFGCWENENENELIITYFNCCFVSPNMGLECDDLYFNQHELALNWCPQGFMSPSSVLECSVCDLVMLLTNNPLFTHIHCMALTASPTAKLCGDLQTPMLMKETEGQTATSSQQ